MKNLKFMMIALVAMFGFISCSRDCDHNFIEHDYSKDIVGFWTVLLGNHAEAMEINADGTMNVTIVSEGELLEQSMLYEVTGNQITITYEDGYVDKGRLDVVPYVGLSIMLDEETGDGYKYHYCEKDLSKDIVGMWVCNDGLTDGVTIMSYSDNGKVTMTTATALGTSDPIVNRESDYVVVGNLVFMELPASNEEGRPMYTAARMTYTPDATSAGDIMTHKKYVPLGDGLKESVMSFLRIKESLDLAGRKYDHIKTFVSNVKGEDKDIDFMGYTFNFAKMDGSGLDKMLKALLFAVEFPDADHLSYSYQMNNNTETYNADIVVEGNKMTIKMSEKVPTLKDVVLYTFQDADCSQFHFYMHKTAFVNFYTNMQAMLMAATDEQFDITNADSVNAIYNNINNAVETINVSLVMEQTTKAL